MGLRLLADTWQTVVRECSGSWAQDLEGDAMRLVLPFGSYVLGTSLWSEEGGLSGRRRGTLWSEEGDSLVGGGGCRSAPMSWVCGVLSGRKTEARFSSTVYHAWRLFQSFTHNGSFKKALLNCLFQSLTLTGSFKTLKMALLKPLKWLS